MRMEITNMKSIVFRIATIAILIGAIYGQDQKTFVTAKDYYYAGNLERAEPIQTAPPKASSPKAPPTMSPGPSRDAAPPFRGPTASRPAPNPGLKYRVVQQINGAETDVSPDKVFHAGDKVRFVFEANLDGYLYVTQQGTSGRWNVLFPDARIPGTNKVEQFQPYPVPATKWFVFDSTPGTETVFVFLSKEPKDLPGLAKTSAKPETVSQSVIDELNSSVKSRDLVFEKDDAPALPAVSTSTAAPQSEKPPVSGNVPVPAGASPSAGGKVNYVVNKGENGEAVVATIRLAHDR